MSKLFRPKIKAPPVPQPEPIPVPKPVRMPTRRDPSIENAAKKTRMAALRRRGRLSTILTDQTKQTVGSSGTDLGA